MGAGEVNYALGRLHAPDPRDRAFPMRSVLPSVPVPTYRYWPRMTILDQGPTGTCVAHAWLSLHQGSPIRFRADSAFDAFALYRKIVLVDEWPDNDGEALVAPEQMQFGTSVRAGAKACQALGWLSGYVWAQSLDDIVRHVALRGPIVFGTNFYRGMAYPDTHGRVTVSGPLEGGHGYVLDGVNIKNEVFRWPNSWGTGWGIKGYAWLTFKDVARLLAEDGEAAAPQEVKA
jgi:hypothetical protein